jgi:hypothetical protein
LAGARGNCDVAGDVEPSPHRREQPFCHDLQIGRGTGQESKRWEPMSQRIRIAVVPQRGFECCKSHLVEALERVGKCQGLRKVIRVVQGSEFVSRDLELWAYKRCVILDFSRPSKPTDNAFIESFNGKLRRSA